MSGAGAGSRQAAGVPFSSFQEASDAVLALLQMRIPMGLWMVTRTVEDDWIVLRAADRSYGVADGDLFRWSDSFCYRMLRGEGPNIAPESSAVPAYAAAPIGRDIPIEAYVGFPLIVDEQVFGTLCAIDPQQQTDALQSEADLIATLASLLSTILATQVRANRLSALADELLDVAHRDPLTGTLNRRGWDRLLTRAQENIRAFGTRHGVVVIDLDGLKGVNDQRGHAAGDAHLRLAGEVLLESNRTADVVARIGGDEFGILLEDPDGPDPSTYCERLADDLDRAGVPASIGWAVADTVTPVLDAVATADARMYENKWARRG